MDSQSATKEDANITPMAVKALKMKSEMLADKKLELKVIISHTPSTS